LAKVLISLNSCAIYAPTLIRLTDLPAGQSGSDVEEVFLLLNYEYVS
jgi:hypothetical protein